MIKLYTKLNDIKSGFGLVIGNFDGVHAGHRKFLKKFKKKCEELGINPVLLTYNPHPQIFFNQEIRDFIIADRDRKYYLVGQCGINSCVELSFNQDLQSLSAEDFLSQIIFSCGNLKYFAMGYDFALGAGKTDSKALVRALCLKHNVLLSEEEPLVWQGEIISSSRIRKILKQGDISTANAILERNFQISGVVTKGRQIGSQKLVPTANVECLPEQALPLNGVYKTLVRLNNQYYQSITNVGTRPSVDKNQQRVIETHILDFNKNIYDEEVVVEFIEFLREEKRFDNLDQLRSQIRIDIKMVRSSFAKGKSIRLALIGKNIRHSQSRLVYENLLNRSVEYDFLDFDSPDGKVDIDQLLQKYEGLNITAPFKKKFLSDLKVEGEYRDAVNVVRHDLRAINTDYEALKSIYIRKFARLAVENCWILGDGAMGEMVVSFLKSQKQSFRVFSRRLDNLSSFQDHLSEQEGSILIINTISREFQLGIQVPPNLIVHLWDMNYGVDYGNQVLSQPNLHYTDGLELLELQAKYALNFWNLKSQ